MAPLTLNDAREQLATVMERTQPSVQNSLLAALKRNDEELAVAKRRMGDLIRQLDVLITYFSQPELQALEGAHEKLVNAQETRRRSYDVLAEAAPEEAWYWTEEWQAGERAIEAERAARHNTSYYTEDEFDAALKAARA